MIKNIPKEPDDVTIIIYYIIFFNFNIIII